MTCSSRALEWLCSKEVVLTIRQSIICIWCGGHNSGLHLDAARALRCGSQREGSGVKEMKERERSTTADLLSQGDEGHGNRQCGDGTNGAWGEIVDIILHPDEPPIGNDPVVHLKYLPAYLLVKLACTQASQLEGLDKAVIPVEPTMMTMRISVLIPNHKVVTHTVWC